MDSPSSSFENVFTHEPLPDAANYIRLLEVLDDDYSETIKVRCELTKWPIDSVPSYRAISYTWGDPESNTFILMNDKTLLVRTNCEFALKQAYWYKKKRSKWPRKRWYYWVDAICIDQTNLGEKGSQYKSSHTTVYVFYALGSSKICQFMHCMQNTNTQQSKSP